MLQWHEGRDGYLFLDNDSNQVWMQIAGEWVPPYADFSERWRARHVARVALCQALGAQYYHVLAPNKETSLLRMAAYEKGGKPLNDPRPPMLKVLSVPFPGKERIFYAPWLLASGEYFFVTDSHWNHKGALKYLLQALVAFNLQSMVSLLGDGLQGWETIQFQGDLGLHAGRPPEPEQQPVYNNNAELVFENNVVNEGYVRHYISKTAPLNRRAVIMHDSTIHRLYTSIARMYRESFFIHCPDFDPSFTSMFGADDVFFFQMERFAVRLSSNEVSYRHFVEGKETGKAASTMFGKYLDDSQILRGPGKV